MATADDRAAFDATSFAREAAAAIALPLPAHCEAGVAANLARLAAVAEALMAFALPDGTTRDVE